MSKLHSIKLKWCRRYFLAALVCSSFAPNLIYGQFTTVINSPPTTVPSSISSGTQVNVYEGGKVPSGFTAGSYSTPGSNMEVNVLGGTTGGFTAYSGSTFNITGGAVQNLFYAYGGSVVNISGGTIGPYTGDNSFWAWEGSVVNISGGTFGRNMYTRPQSTVNISGGTIGWGATINGKLNVSGGYVGNFQTSTGSEVNVSGGMFGQGVVNGGGTITLLGGEFRLDGVLINNLTTIGSTANVSVPTNSVLSGVLANGTPFAFSSLRGDSMGATLKVAALPATSPATITLPADPTPAGVRDGQTLVVGAGVALDHLRAGWGSTVQVTGAQYISDLEAVHAQISHSHGNVSTLTAFTGTTADVSGDAVMSNFVGYGSVLNVSGGSVKKITAQRGSTVNISGGIVGEANASAASVDAANSHVRLSGGALGDRFQIGSSDLTVTGGEFRVNGNLVAGLGSVGNQVATSVPAGAQLTGTLADGTPFAFTSSDSDSFSGSVTLVASALPAVGPAQITAPTDVVPLGIRQGQTLVVNAGGNVGENFNAGWGSTVRVEGGSIASNFEAVGSHVVVSSGSIDFGFDALSGAVVDISGGTISSMQAHAGSTVNVAGGSTSGEALSGSQVNVSSGTLAGSFMAQTGSIVNISGGSLGNSFDVRAGGTLNMSGGSFDTDFDAFSGSAINLLGSEFLLNGAPISGLALNSPFLLTTRNATLSGVLLDGTAFSYVLSSTNSSSPYFDAGATLKLTLLLAGDHNRDGTVDAADYVAWRKGLGTAFSQSSYDVWRARFGGAGGSGSMSDAAVPEPACSLLLILGAAIGCSFRRGRILAPPRRTH
jgi:hypothetical protein